MSLIPEDLRKFPVSPNSIMVWWLGQAGFILKSPQGMLAALDPYLSDSCGPAAEKLGFNFYRSFASPVPAEQLSGFDVYAMTHSHADHLDLETISRYRQAGGKGPYLVPPNAAAKLEELGVTKEQIAITWPGKVYAMGDLRFRTTLAIPFGNDDLTHVGYLVSLEAGPMLYFTGDTGYHEAIGRSVAEYKPDVMFVVINGMWHSLGPADAAKLADQIKPGLVIPYHYDLFPDGQMPPHTLRMNLFLYGMMDKFRTIEVGVPFICGGQRSV